jgi:hypothetical protein
MAKRVGQLAGSSASTVVVVSLKSTLGETCFQTGRGEVVGQLD